MHKDKSRYRWDGWDSSGRESMAFNVKHPCELMGVHAKLIDNELTETEKIEYCIYSPCFPSTSTPFGLTAGEASTGLCVTDNRFIVSKNRHLKGIAPAVEAIDFKEVIYINIGSALLLGWFSLFYARDNQIRNIPVIFNAAGRQHFEKCILSFKKYSPAVCASGQRLNFFPASGFIRAVSSSAHRERVKNITDLRERCVLAFPCRYVWYKFKRRIFFLRKQKRYCAASCASVILTTKALLLARDSLGFSTGSSVDILNIPLEKITAVTWGAENVNNLALYTLKMHFAPAAENNALNIPLTGKDKDIRPYVNDLVSFFSKQ